MKSETAFDSDLRRLDAEIGELEETALRVSIDAERATRYVYRLYQRASLKGDLRELDAAQEALDTAIRHVGPAPDLAYVRASIDFKLHRLKETRRDLEAVPELLESFEGRTLLAELAFEEGRYEEARQGYEKLIEEEPTWDNLARLAHLYAALGDVEVADRFYLEAEDELTAKEMRSFAWVELQRGKLALQLGRAGDARSIYERAARAYTGYWLTDEHMAELLGATGKYDEAIALYRLALTRVAKPEIEQALGKLYSLVGQPEEAEGYYERALDAYLKSAARGDVHYYHHLVDFYTDAREDAALALEWARKDCELRPNFRTQGALAHALYLNGLIPEALSVIREALASGARDGHLLRDAALIHRAAGETGDAHRFEHLAAGLNPHEGAFHVHH